MDIHSVLENPQPFGHFRQSGGSQRKLVTKWWYVMVLIIHTVHVVEHRATFSPLNEI